MGYETARKIINEGLESLHRYYSVYRGIVLDNDDKEKGINRIKVQVPDVMGGICTWAYPKGQHGSTMDGFKYLPPQVGDIVWVTFEFGDPTKPLWEYHGWGVKQTPPLLMGKDRFGFITPEGNQVIMEDRDGTLFVGFNGDITISTPETVIVDAKDVIIKSSDTVMVNDGSNRGLVNILELTEKLNQLVSQVEKLRTLLNTHTHSGVTTGPGTSGTTLTPLTEATSSFNVKDYEDTKCIH